MNPKVILMQNLGNIMKTRKLDQSRLINIHIFVVKMNEEKRIRSYLLNYEKCTYVILTIPVSHGYVIQYFHICYSLLFKTCFYDHENMF